MLDDLLHIKMFGQLEILLGVIKLDIDQLQMYRHSFLISLI